MVNAHVENENNRKNLHVNFCWLVIDCCYLRLLLVTKNGAFTAKIKRKNSLAPTERHFFSQTLHVLTSYDKKKLYIVHTSYIFERNWNQVSICFLKGLKFCNEKTKLFRAHVLSNPLIKWVKKIVTFIKIISNKIFEYKKWPSCV